VTRALLILVCKIPRILAFVWVRIGCDADLRRAALCSGDGSPSGHDAIELQIFESDIEKVQEKISEHNAV
jgi:hypothetical protein